jgi:hypothetical protein
MFGPAKLCDQRDGGDHGCRGRIGNDQCNGINDNDNTLIMALFAQPKEIDVVSQQIDGEQKRMAGLLAEKDLLETDLVGYESDGYESFKKVLAKEKIRLALLRMTVPVEDQLTHEKIHGQFLEADLLERNKETIEYSLKLNAKRISDASARIEALKKQIAKRIKEK